MSRIPLKLLAELGRSQYHPSGRIEWELALPRFAVTILGGAAIAVGLWYFQSIDQAYIILNACAAAIAALRLTTWMVVAGHCRNPKVAMILALPIGLVAYFGYFQAQLVESSGWQMAYRIDKLPAIIWHSWNTQQFVFERAGGVFEYQFIGNVVVFWIECLIVIGIPFAGAEHAARQVYSEETQRWAKSTAIVVSPDVIREFELALRSHRLAELFRELKRLHIENPKKPPARCVMVLTYTDGEPQTGYLSMTYIAMFSKRIIFQLRLTPQELDACRSTFTQCK